jgi:hypothetical protein
LIIGFRQSISEKNQLFYDSSRTYGCLHEKKKMNLLIGQNNTMLDLYYKPISMP